jgi:hypothetical protein
MPNDAKLGLLVGVGLTVAVAVVFFSKDAPPGKAEGRGNAPAASAAFQAPPPPGEALLGREPTRTGGQATGWQKE